MRGDPLALARFDEARRGVWGAAGCVCAPLAAIAVAFAAAVPAHADPTVYVVSTGSGNVFQFGVSPNDGSLAPLGQPTVFAGQSASNVVVSPNGRSVYVTTRGAVAQYDV